MYTQSRFSFQKALLLFLLITTAELVGGRLNAQGVKLLSKEQFENLPAPGIRSGAGDLDPQHIIPDNYFPQPGNQGDYFSCAGWAIGYATHSFYENKIKANSPITNDAFFSYSYIYNLLRECKDCKCGIELSKLLSYLKGNGNVPLKNYSAPCSTPKPTLATTASKFRIRDYSPVNTLNLNDVKGYVMNDVPVIICIGINAAFQNFKAKTNEDIFSLETLIDPLYHAVVVTGYDDGKNAFKIINSYGTDWGLRGYAWIDYETFRKMTLAAQGQGFIIQKDYDLFVPGSPPNSMADYRVSFHPYATQETFGKNLYTFTAGFKIDDSVHKGVLKIRYQYDDPFAKTTYSSSYKGPNFENSYVGQTCLSKIKATVYLKNDSSFTVNINACNLIDNPQVFMSNSEKIANITATATAEYLNKDSYRFKVLLKGLEGLKDDISEVVYDRNDPSFGNHRFDVVKNADTNFESSYNGWGCLDHISISIYFKDNSTKHIEFNMCKELGWQDTAPKK